MAAANGTGETFGALLRRYRQAATLSQEELAERAGLSVDAVSTLERGRRSTPRPDTLALLIKALGLTPEDRTVLIAAARPQPTTLASAGVAPPEHASAAAIPSVLHIEPLPMALTELIGREREVAAVRTRLLEPSTRLITLTGPGGTGKTRLALAVARSCDDAFPDGVAFISLAPLVDPELVLPTIAHSLGLAEAPGRSPLETLQAALGGARLLLVLDNFEQVVTAGPGIADLVAGSAGLVVLVTSRMPLHVQGERMHAVPPLSVPTPTQAEDPAALADVEAVRLFVERARDMLPDFALSAENAAAVGAICARLDGLPLAIELAAARVRYLPPRALLKRLDHSLVLLTGGPRNVPERQQTLRNAIAWSYALLDEEGQALLRRVSVFVGGWTLEAAEAVCTAPCDLPTLQGDMLLRLSALADQSLVVVEEGPEGEPRFRLLELIREYALEQTETAGEVAILRQAHTAYFLSLAEEAAKQLTWAEVGPWPDRLEREHDNLRAALAWAREQGANEEWLRLAGALWPFWNVQGYFSEGRAWLEDALTAGVECSPAARAKALHGAGNLAQRQGDNRRETALHEEALLLHRKLGDRLGIARSLWAVGVAAENRGAYGQAAALLEESLALSYELDDRLGIAASLGILGRVVQNLGEYERAEALYEESLVLFRALNEGQFLVVLLNFMGGLAYAQGQYQRAVQYFEESLALARELGARLGIAEALLSLEWAAQARGEYRREAQLEEILKLAIDLGARSVVVGVLELLARIAGAGTQSLRAAWLGGAAEALREALGEPLSPEVRAGHDQAVHAMRTALGDEAFESAWAKGQELSLSETLALVVQAPSSQDS